MPRIALLTFACVLLACARLPVATASTAADAKSQALLNSFLAASKNVRTLQAHVVLTTVINGVTRVQEGRIVLSRKEGVRQDLWSDDSATPANRSLESVPHSVVISNRVRVITVEGAKRVTRQPFSEAALSDGEVCDLNSVFSRTFGLFDHVKATRYAGEVIDNDTSYQTINQDLTSSVPGDSSVDGHGTVYFGADHLVHRITYSAFDNTLDCALSNIIVNAPVDPRIFVPALPPFAANSRRITTMDVDAEAAKLISLVDERYKTLKALTITFKSSQTKRTQTAHDTTSILHLAWHGTAALEKPNLAHVHTYSDIVESQAMQGTYGDAYCDGHSEWYVWDTRNWFYTFSAGAQSLPARTLDQCSNLSGFFSSTSTQGLPDVDCQVHASGPVTWRGKPYRVVTFTVAKSAPGDQRVALLMHLYVGPTYLVEKTDLHFLVKTERLDTVIDTSFEMSDIKTPGDIPLSEFTFVPPPGAKERAPYSVTPLRRTSSLLGPGDAAPGFTAYTAAGKRVKLSDYAGKVVVLVFWATWYPPCEQALPAANEIAWRYKDKGVVFLAVDTGDRPDAFKSWLPQHHILDSMTFLLDGSRKRANTAATLYGARLIPTEIVIGADGRIAWSSANIVANQQALADAIAAALANAADTPPPAHPAPAVPDDGSA
ncbi:MAG: TlpA disulfide reductase family protein [Capsulimonadaceae bacterium]|nr:TlpA disulfide reductase family protein [Capsulimonadaceae bacterium]